MRRSAARPQAPRTGRVLVKALGALALVVVLAPGCGKSLQLNLIVYDPCNQASLKEADHMEVEIQGTGVDGEGAVWDAASGQGEVEVPVLPDALVSVIGRKSDGGGGPRDAVIATTVGRLDLTGADGQDVVEITVAAGKIGYFMNTTASANPATCTEMTASRKEHSATLLDDGRVLLVGGVGLQPNGDSIYWETSELFRPTDGEFVVGASLKWKRRGHTATKLDDGTVLVAGGIGLISGTEQPLLIGQIYNPDGDSFDGTVEFAQQRAFHTATLLGDGTVLIVGGQFGQSELPSSEIYDPSTHSVRPGPSLQTPRSHHAAVRVGPTTVAIIGGRGSGGVIGTIEFLSTAPSEAIPGPPLATPRSHLVAALIPGQDAVLIAGGFTTAVALAENGVGSDSIEILRLNPSNLRNSAVVCSTLKLSTGRGAAAIGPLPDGLLIAGGVGAASTVANSAEVFRVTSLDACAATSTPTAGALSTARGGAILTPLLGGDLLVTGGFTVASGAQPVLGTVAGGEIFIRGRD